MDFIIYLILLLNSIWDICSFLSICIGGEYCGRISAMHTAMWVAPEDQHNPAVLLLTAIGLAAFAAARACVCFDETMWPIAASSYIVEFAFAIAGVFLGLIHIWYGFFVAASSAILAIACVAPYIHFT